MKNLCFHLAKLLFAPARVLMKVGPNKFFFNSFMLTKEMIFGMTKVVIIMGTFLQITFQVSEKQKGSNMTVTTATIRMYETIEAEMLMPMYPVAKTT